MTSAAEEQAELEIIHETAKQKWMNDNPDQSEFAWELISNRERDSYLFAELEANGHVFQGVEDGVPVFNKQ